MSTSTEDFITREEFERLQRFYNEQMKSVLEKLITLEKRLDGITPSKQISAPVRDIFIRDVASMRSELILLQQRVGRMEKQGNSVLK
jgi:HAMP domain-containing protein